MSNFDTVNFIMDYENGELSDADIIEGFQALIDLGVIGELQGSYGRQAAALIDEGHCSPPARV